MKYIKKYENLINHEYNVGDYIKFTDYYDWYKEPIPYGKIINKHAIFQNETEYEYISYDLFTLSKKELLPLTFTTNNDRISRKLTPSEIEEFEMMLNTNKYNI